MENSVYHLFRWLDILREVITHLRHLPMAVLTHQAAVGHGAAHALRALARVAQVAALLQCSLCIGRVAPGLAFDGRRHDRDQQVVRIVTNVTTFTWGLPVDIKRAMMAVHHVGHGFMLHLVAAVGKGARFALQWTKLGQVQRRCIVTGLADHGIGSLAGCCVDG
jgi:hypothetical protein